MLDFVSDKPQWAMLVRRVANRCRGRDPEDLLQSALLKLEISPPTNAPRDPAAYIVKVAVNIGLDESRRDGKVPSCSLDHLLSVHDDGPLQDEVLLARERLARLRSGLARLSPRTREILLLHRMEGLKHREIAERLAISSSAVEKQVAKAMLILTEWVDG